MSSQSLSHSWLLAMAWHPPCNPPPPTLHTLLVIATEVVLKIASKTCPVLRSSTATAHACPMATASRVPHSPFHWPVSMLRHIKWTARTRSRVRDRFPETWSPSDLHVCEERGECKSGVKSRVSAMQATISPWTRTRGPFQDSLRTEEMTSCPSWKLEACVEWGFWVALYIWNRRWPTPSQERGQSDLLGRHVHPPWIWGKEKGWEQ